MESKKMNRMKVINYFILISTIYTFIYLGLMYCDYFFQTNLHNPYVLFYMFIILGTISLISCLPLYLSNEKKHRELKLKDDSGLTMKLIYLLSKVNLSFVIFNFLVLFIWIVFIAGPGV